MSSSFRCRTLGGCGLVLVSLGLLAGLGPASGVSVADESISAIEHAKTLSRAFRQAARQVTPSVVTVIAKSRVRTTSPRLMWDDPRFRGQIPLREPGPSEDGEAAAEIDAQLGSGVIIRAQGIVLTNNHVVEDASRVVIRLPDGSEVPATDIRTDRLSDLAILRIRGSGPFPAATLGDSDQLEIGDWVIAVGSPFELETTVSAGIISGKGRSIEKIERGKLLQTDAAINPGNSGGPLVNLEGQVVGINTAIASSSGGYQGIGFAIPINRAQWVIRQLETEGRVQRGYLGINIGEITPELAAQYQRPVRSGVIVRRVLDGTPAAQAGMEQDDIIVDFAGVKIRDVRDLQTNVEQKKEGSSQRVTVVRDGKRVELTVVVRTLPDPGQ
jgi:serine protease Do